MDGRDKVKYKKKKGVRLSEVALVEDGKEGQAVCHSLVRCPGSTRNSGKKTTCDKVKVSPYEEVWLEGRDLEHIVMFQHPHSTGRLMILTV